MQVSGRGAVDPFIVMDVVEAARRAENAGRHIIHMEVGQPSTGLPTQAREAVATALGAGPLGYTVSLGLPELRHKIAGLYEKWYGLQIDPSRVVVTSGASGAFVLAFSALFDNDARVAMALPGYPSYRQILKAMGLKSVGIKAAAENGFQPRPAEIEPDIDGLIVASPSNPTGTTLSRPDLAALIAHCRAHDITFISDEIYHGLHYDTPATSALAICDDVVVINSFSKYFSMTGWRVGWMVVPPGLVRTVERLAQNMFICAPHVAQVAALAAMDCVDECEANLAIYAKNRQIVGAGLKAAGLPDFAPPDGAFYYYVDVSQLTDDALQLSRDLLEHAGIAATPGLDFDPHRGATFLRFSYAGSTDDMHEGMRRLAAFTKGRLG